MRFKLFSQLYDDALEYRDCDMFIAERGWQDWMDAYANSGADVGLVLIKIWDIAHMDIKAMRATLGLSQAAFSLRYTIPARSIENWEAGIRNPPAYLTKLIAYTVLPWGNGYGDL